ncbi:hypothetical protein G9P44_005174 [Scheffersomyces stipitis]|nr:hypothetical protein G9P44_005174 [Scheffersomyces stipitis]
MTGKRKRISRLNSSPRSRERDKKTGKGDVFIPAQNNFHHLPEEDSDSDSSVIFDYDSREKNEKSDVKVSNQDESVIVAISDDDDNNDDENENEQDGNVKVSKTEKNELAKNEDFIGFGFSSSEEENNDHDHSEQKEMADWLTMEMKDFVNYISPSSEEIRTRNRLINKLKSSISSYWPETETHVFGSSATDLYLPGSDIDIVIVSRTGDYENRSRLYQLSSYLRHKGLAKNMEVIAKAKVPIIKFVDPESNVNIDVSFERRNGIEAAKKIRRWMTTTPGLRELVLIIKQFLSSRRLNNVHSGGLGGYATIILCYHFLMMHPRVSTNSINITDNLGALLIEFFELYGRNFSYDNLIISLDPRLPHLNTNKNPFTIVVQDPSDEDNNITRSSYNLRDLKKSARKEDFNDDRHKVINDALINHESSEDESDGADGNDKYYYSDITVESDDELQFEVDVPKKESAKKEAESAVHTKKQVEEILGLKGDNPEEDEEEGEGDYSPPDTTKEDEEEDATDMKRSKSNLDKDVRRDYWRQKGLEL